MTRAHPTDTPPTNAVRSAGFSPAALVAAARSQPGRLLGACLLVSLVAAVMTGPSSNGDHPFHGVRESLSPPRVFVFLALGVALWVAFVAGGRVRPLIAVVSARLAGPRQRLDRPLGRAGGNLALLAIAIIAPQLVSQAAQQSMVTDIGLYALLALGLNVVVGYAGLLDLGYIAFFAIGAYTTGYFTSSIAMPWHAPFVLNPFFVLPIAVAVTALAGVILGGPTLRLRGDYLAIVTLGFGEIVQLLAQNAQGITNGPRGVSGVPPLSINIGPIHYQWSLDPVPYYYLLLAFVVIVMFVFGRLERSRTGRAWAAIREDEVAAEATGVPTLRLKLMAFAIGASVSGFAGVIFATEQFFAPDTFSLQNSILVLVLVIFGGMGSRLGVVVGAVVLQGLAYFLRDKVPPEDRYIYFGAVVIIMMIFRPQGLVPSRRRRRELRLAEEGLSGADSLAAAPSAERVA